MELPHLTAIATLAEITRWLTQHHGHTQATATHLAHQALALGGDIFTAANQVHADWLATQAIAAHTAEPLATTPPQTD